MWRVLGIPPAIHPPRVVPPRLPIFAWRHVASATIEPDFPYKRRRLTGKSKFVKKMNRWNGAEERTGGRTNGGRTADGRKNGRMEGRANGGTNDGRTDGRTSGRTIARTGAWITVFFVNPGSNQNHRTCMITTRTSSCRS